jgi:hypothetical protein
VTMAFPPAYRMDRRAVRSRRIVHARTFAMILVTYDPKTNRLGFRLNGPDGGPLFGGHGAFAFDTAAAAWHDGAARLSTEKPIRGSHVG